MSSGSSSSTGTLPTTAALQARLVGPRLNALREHMAAHRLDVYLVPSSDEHLNEFLPDYKLRRQALSGFTGSAGDMAITREAAHLFVDSRYHLQAEQETDPALVTVHKLGQPQVKALPEWLEALQAERGGLKVGFDPFQMAQRQARGLSRLLGRDSALVPVAGNLADLVWEDRPAPPHRPVTALPESLHGEPVAEKLARVRKAMAEAGVSALVLTKLDEVAWLTNCRGEDIPHNPVFEGYLLVEAERARLFTDNPLEASAVATLEGLAAVAPYSAFAPALAELEQAHAALEATGKADEATPARAGKIWLDAAGGTEGVRLLLGRTPLHTASPNPVTSFKALKNPVEIEAMLAGHVQAGVAKVRAFAALEARLAAGSKTSEADFAHLLSEEYGKLAGFTQLSFTTICGFAENGAIVHYGTPDPERFLEPGGLLLVDSGIQITGATTDDTRTIIIGAPDQTQQERFTAVLRGHIRLAMQVFPAGTTGVALDAVARAPLWNEGMDYGHGTGHGVGAYLNVHEGPHNISPRGQVPLEPGMIVSNEPGYYHDGWGGIRCENLYLVEAALGLHPHPAGSQWLRFFPLTLIPFDTRLLLWERMTHEEQAWLRAYHERVESTLAPLLEGEALAWLKKACVLPPA